MGNRRDRHGSSASGSDTLTSDREPAVVVLISGSGTNLQALIDATATRHVRATIAAVISDRADARGLDRARSAAIPALALERQDFSSRADHELALMQAIDSSEPAAVVLAGFMRVLGPTLVERYRGRLINLHPSLLPRHRGLDTHRRVLEAADRHHGATVHFVTEELDAGPPVIQYRFSVDPQDTPERLAARVQRGEHIILPRAVGWLTEGRLRLVNGRVMLDGQELIKPVQVEAES